MALSVRPSQRVCFCEFQLDLETAELQSKGHKLILQDQPFQVLTILLRHPGRLVTREELKKELWPTNTFVDFDHGLHKAVNRLREALDDSAEHPRFIETLPRRGYRFVAPVDCLIEPSPKGDSEAITQNPLSDAPRSFSLKLAAGALGPMVAFGTWLAWRNIWPARSDGAIRSIAVLPLENLSRDSPHQDYFADGMTAELITHLGQIGSLRVISRTSAMQYKGVHKPLPQIARELNVDAVMEGTVLRSGEHIRITVQLIEAHTDQHLWAESYKGDIRDVLELQDQVASAIAGRVRAKLTPEQQAALKASHIVNPEAYESYLRAISQRRRTVDGLHQRISYFEQALAKQHNYPEAHAGLGDAYLMLGHMVALPPQEAFPRAKAEALKALQFDETLAEAHELLAATTFLYDWDFSSAEKEFRRAIALNPNSTLPHYSDFLNAMGRHDEAIAEMTRVREIDPLSLSAVSAIGWEQYWAGQYDSAIENARNVLSVDPNDWRAHHTLGLSLEEKHQFSDGLVELQKAADLSNDYIFVAFVAHAKARAGDKMGARKILADLEVRARRTYVSPWLFAIIYAGLDEKENAFLWLEKCYQGREHDLVFTNVWPMFNNLHSDPRYLNLLRRIGLSQ
jgi:TolB-like protein/DNA-binding winged helix-turn-helix (wHTH) protein